MANTEITIELIQEQIAKVEKAAFEAAALVLADTDPLVVVAIADDDIDTWDMTVVHNTAWMMLGRIDVPNGWNVPLLDVS